MIYFLGFIGVMLIDEPLTLKSSYISASSVSNADTARFFAGVDMLARHYLRTCFYRSSYIAVAGVTYAFYITLLAYALRLAYFYVALDGLHYSFNCYTGYYWLAYVLMLLPFPTLSNIADIASFIIYSESARSIMHSIFYSCS